MGQVAHSGTNRPVLFGPVSNHLHCLQDQQGISLSSTGATSTSIGQVDLTVASHVFRDLFIGLETDASPQPVGDGLLPLSLFDAIYINNHQNFVILNPHARPLANQASVTSRSSWVRGKLSSRMLTRNPRRAWTMRWLR